MLPRHQLHIDNRTITNLQSVKLSLVILTESWAVARKSFFGKPIYAWLYGPAHFHVYWSLDIEVDDESGEDGAARPQLRMPADISGFPSRLEELSGLRMAETESQKAEAYYGNDAPALCNNSLEIGDWLDNEHINVRWTADYHWSDRSPVVIPFLFEGAAEFTGLQMSVKLDEDAPVFLSHMFPNLDLSTLVMSYGRENVIPHKNYAADRRRWREVTWKKKNS